MLISNNNTFRKGGFWKKSFSFFVLVGKYDFSDTLFARIFCSAAKPGPKRIAAKERKEALR
jgi:hypothetical protein